MTTASFLTAAVGVIVTLVLVTKMLMTLVSHRKWLGRFKAVPGDPTNLIFGNLLQYPGPGEAGLAFQRGISLRHPRMGLFWVMHSPMLMIHHPDTAKVILRSSEPKGSVIYELLRPWIGDGLLNSNGGKWARNRRLLTPAFHFEILKNYVQVKNRCADALEENFSRYADGNEALNVFDHVTMFTLDVILRCSMSYSTDCQTKGERHPYVTAVNDISRLVVKRFFTPWFYPNAAYSLTPSGRLMQHQCNLVHKVAMEVIQKRKVSLDQSNTASEKKRVKCMDFLDILLTARDEQGQGLSEEEIRDEVDTFLFEGHDTTASAISWGFYSIAGHPDVQRRIQEELDEVFQGERTSDVMWEDLSKLTYLTQVVKETLRLHSPVPFIQRTLSKDTAIGGSVLPKGCVVAVNIYNLHLNPLVWDDPMTFDPERFSLDNNLARDSYAFVPFSAGPRNCIGQAFALDEIKLCLARILYRFSIRLDPTHKVEKEQGVVMKAKNDIKIFVSCRNNNKNNNNNNNNKEETIGN